MALFGIIQISELYKFQIWQGYIKYFATKLGNFTNFKMLFLAVVIDFVLSVKIKTQSK